MLDKIKQGLKNQFIVILGMFVFNVFTGIMVGVATSKKVFVSESTSFIKSYGYNVNLYIFIPCMIILLLGYSLFWSRLFKKYVIKNLEIHWAFIILYVVIYILFLIINAFIGIMSEIGNIGLFNDIVNIPDYIFYIMMAYSLLYPIISLVITYKKFN